MPLERGGVPRIRVPKAIESPRVGRHLDCAEAPPDPAQDPVAWGKGVRAQLAALVAHLSLAPPDPPWRSVLREVFRVLRGVQDQGGPPPPRERNRGTGGDGRREPAEPQGRAAGGAEVWQGRGDL